MANIRKRVDPRSRRADGFLGNTAVKNADPNKHYVWANPNQEETGVPFLAGRGYEVEEKREGGPCSVIPGLKGDGNVVPGPYGTVLMSIDREAFEAEQAECEDLNRRRDKAMRVKTQPFDERMQLRSGWRVINETSDLVEERGA